MLGERLVGTATAVAHKLARDALWSRDMCSWVGLHPRYDKGDVVAIVLGPSVYDGSAGIAYFLADAYAVTREQPLRRAAAGALVHALSQTDDLIGKGFLGLYDGLSGVMFAAASCADLCEREDLGRAAFRYVDHLEKAIPDLDVCDVVSGLAGIAAVLMYLSRSAEHDRLLDLAARAGDRLVLLAKRTALGAMWPSGRGDGLPLNGYSHGAGGIGAVLVELFARTGEERFKATALQAFAFERSTYTDVWPDLRISSKAVDPRPESERAMFAWCHGAPGILLSRIHAASVLQEDALARDAEKALAATLDALPILIGSGSADTCACHGLSGIAVILRLAAEAGMGRDVGEQVDKISRATLDLLERRGVLPTGLSRFEDTPQFMIGASGTAECLLQLAGRSHLCWPLDVRFVL